MYEYFYDGLFIGLSTTVLTFFLDLLSLSYIYKLFKKDGGRELYIKSIFYNLFNNLILGTSAYVFFSYIFSNNIEKSFPYLIFEILLLLLIQAFGYYFAHMIMHTKRFYFIHKFHHQYSDIVIPMSANAVSIYEYCFAYMLPFILGIMFVNPSTFSLKVAIRCVSLANLLIHTPWLSEFSNKFVPNYFVKTTDHLEHHLKSRTKYAAPILNIDYFDKYV